MQLKEAFYRRMQAQKLNQPKIRTNKKNQPLPIGSTKLGRLQYKGDEKFFQSFKMREDVTAAKAFIKQTIDPDILETRKKKWNASVSVPKSFEKEESQESKLLKIRLGVGDFPPVTPKGNKIYEGTETRNNYTNWNVSNLITQKQKSEGQTITQNLFYSRNLNAFENSVKHNSTLKNYKKPIQRYRQNQQEMKQQFSRYASTLDSFQQSFLYFNPNASPQLTQAMTLKYFDDIQRSRKMQLSDYDTQQSLSTGFKANLTKSQKQKISYKYFHTGTWGKEKNAKQSQSDREDQDCWSCCMNYEKNSRGCCKRIIDGNRANYATFNFDK